MNTQSNDYIYSNVQHDMEGERLSLLNATHNPYTLKYMQKRIPGQKRILEIGCGNGDLAFNIAELKDNDAGLVAIDKAASQVKSTQDSLASKHNTHVYQLDITKQDSVAILQTLGPFDLIYCRWLICHIPYHQQSSVLKHLLSLLTEGGQFVMDECDNRYVSFVSHVNDPASHQLARQATYYFTQFYDLIAKQHNLNLKMDPNQALNLLNEAAQGKGEAKLLGTYQVPLKTSSDKRMVYLGKLSAAKAHAELAEQEITDQIIQLYFEIMYHDSIEGQFLRQNVVVFNKRRI